MTTMSELIARATSQSEYSNLLESDKFGIISAKSYGLLGDNSTDDYTALYSLVNTTIAGDDAILVFPSGIYLIGTSINIPSNIKVVLLPGADIKPSSSSVEVNIYNSVNLTMDTSGNFLQVNEAVDDIIVDGAVVDSTLYGVLINSGASGTNARISNCKIESDADPIEINNTSGTFSQVQILGNVLNAAGTSGSSSSGFAVGIAEGKDVIVANNIIEHSRREAIHIEDAQNRILVNGNICNSCYLDGARILNLSGATPVILTNNYFKKDDTNLAADSGILCVYDTNGALAENVFSNNIIDGFAYGIYLNGTSTSNASSNTIRNCTTAIYNNYGVLNGKNIACNCTTLVTGNVGSITDKVISLTTPTNILTFTGSSNTLGATLKGFSFPVATFTSANAGNNETVLFAVPSIFSGRLNIGFSFGSNFIKYSCDIFYDGTNLSVGSAFNSQNGVIAFISLYISSGNLTFKTYTASSLNVTYWVDFDGEFYLEA